jgi:hypothetical protein
MLICGLVPFKDTKVKTLPGSSPYKTWEPRNNNEVSLDPRYVTETLKHEEQWYFELMQTGTQCDYAVTPLLCLLHQLLVRKKITVVRGSCRFHRHGLGNFRLRQGHIYVRKANKGNDLL